MDKGALLQNRLRTGDTQILEVEGSFVFTLAEFL
jgi:hypothetical protein